MDAGLPSSRSGADRAIVFPLCPGGSGERPLREALGVGAEGVRGDEVGACSGILPINIPSNQEKKLLKH